MEQAEQEINLVSICIPCYNAALFLRETLNCLLNQSYQMLEIIIIDDNSTDSSIPIIEEYALRDGRVRFETAKSKGAAAARNQAYQLSKGKYVTFFDADDWIPENFIATQLQALSSDHEVVVAKWGRFYQDDLATIKEDPIQIRMDLTFEEWIKHYWLNNTHMTCPGRVLMPRILIEQSGLWDEDLSLNDDFIFYTRIFSNSGLIRFNDVSLFFYRSGVNGLSSKKGDHHYRSLYKSITRAIVVAQAKLKESKEINNCYANLLQSLIYEVYPLEPKIIKEAEKCIKALGGSNFKYQGGRKTKFLNFLFGWKLTTKLKMALSNT